MSEPVDQLAAELARLRRERDELAAEVAVMRHYRTAVDEATVGIATVAADKGRYVLVNRAFAEFLGRPYEGMLESDAYQNWTQAVRAEDLQAEMAGVERIAKGEISSIAVDSRRMLPTGSERWMRARIRASGYAEGRLEYLTVFLEDVDELHRLRRENEELISQAQRAQKMEAVGSLVGGVVHDFNNRLVIIMGYCELLKAGLGSQSDLVASADIILDSAKGAAALTRQLLAYSRRQVLKPEPFDLNELVKRVDPLIRSATGDRVTLRIKLGAQRNAFADTGQIEQVILNLVLNARDAMAGKAGDATLTLETGDTRLSPGEIPGAKAGDYVTLVVADTGTGIAPQVLPRIFEPFFTTKDAGQGTGLGLAMVDGIVRQSGGWTHVESTLGIGSRFTVYLPRTPKPIAPAAAPAPSEPAPRTVFETVLVCDDDDNVREMLSKILRLRGYQILAARNGRHALELAATHPGRIHLLLTDLAMPGMSGIELARELRKRDEELRTLFMSGYAEDADLVSMSLGPRTYFVAKPFLPGDLTRAVSSILEGPKQA